MLKRRMFETLACVGLLFGVGGVGSAGAQGAPATGVVRGIVTNAEGAPVDGATVLVRGTALRGSSDPLGRYAVARVPMGLQTLAVQRPGYKPQERQVRVTADAAVEANFTLEAAVVVLSDVLVQGASLTPERVVDAPAAVEVVSAAAATALSATAQLPLVLKQIPNVDVAQNDFQDFNLNSHGFNKTFTRRILVLQDGRDLSLAFLGTQEWSALAIPIEDMSRIEMVRGPGSALYGANAFNGVLNLVTPPARDIVGTKVSVAGGEYATRRFDLRHAAVFADGRWGWRANVGYSHSETLSRSRTNIGDLTREYAPYVDTTRYPVVAPIPGFELGTLNGQTKTGPFGAPGAAVGTPDPLQSVYGSARLDRYADDGSIATIEVGTAQVQNETQMAAIGRVQYGEAARPWARAAWSTAHWNVLGSYSGRTTLAPGHALASNDIFQDVSGVSSAEVQYHGTLPGDKARVVLGASERLSTVNSRHTLVAAAHDDRADKLSSVYGQLDYALSPAWRLVAAARVDGGDLIQTQFSPKAVIQWTPDSSQSLRITVNRAFQMPNVLEFFVRFPAGPPADLSALEGGLRASPLGPLLAGVPQGTLFSQSNAVPSWVLGNENLKVERVASLEVGYKRQLGSRVFVTVDAHYSQLNDFVTDVLPGVNPAYGPWTAPAQVPAAQRAVVEQAVRGALIAGGQAAAAAGMTRLGDGSTAFVFSMGNAGRASERGMSISADAQITDELRATANFTISAFDVDSASLAPGSHILPNTPGSSTNLSVTYVGRGGLDVWVGTQVRPAFDWSSGVWAGRIPPSATMDISVGYRFSPALRLFTTVTNAFDERTYQVYGGTIVGRRALLGLTVTR